MAIIDNVKRARFRFTGDEPEVVWAMLEFYRQTLLFKCEGLDQAQLRLRPIVPSNLSLLGLLRHLTVVERYWFQECLDGQALDPLYTQDDPDGDFNDLDSAPAQEVWRRYQAQCDISRGITAVHSFDEVVACDLFGTPVSLRFIGTHLVDEYARHCGHADLLREVIDGTVGH